MRCERQLIPNLDDQTVLSERISNNAKFSPYLDNCDGALDGTHIPAVTPLADQGVYRNREKFFSQNVLGVCNFDLIFENYKKYYNKFILDVPKLNKNKKNKNYTNVYFCVASVFIIVILFNYRGLKN